MAPDPRTRFREQAEGALMTFAGTVAYLLFVVGRDTEVRTEGDRVLVVVCVIGAIAALAVVLGIAVRGAIRRRRERAAAGAGRAAAKGDADH
ncbi:hypothetical protein DZG02_14550, partial [Clavibacter lycopersici]